MYKPSFNSCWVKIERAKEHRDGLDRYIRETFSIESNRPRLGIKFDSKTGEHVLYVNFMPDLRGPLDQVSVMLGDIVHNLRSALDHLVFQLALGHTNGNVRKERLVQFPVDDTAQTFSDKSLPQCLSEIHPDHQAIIERFQAYHPCDENHSVGPYFHPLAMLRDLSNTDKHRLLPTVMIPGTGVQNIAGASSLAGAGLVFTLGFIQKGAMAALQGNLKQFKPLTEQVQLGTEIARAVLPYNALPQGNADMAGYVSPDVSLSEGRAVVAVIDKIAAVVVKVIHEFEPLF